MRLQIIVIIHMRSPVSAKLEIEVLTSVYDVCNKTGTPWISRSDIYEY